MKTFYFFILILSSFFLAPYAQAKSQIALIASDKAIIYADITMQSPIGFVKRGKRIRVGSVKRSQGELLPVVINGRIAYIKVSDLDLTDFEGRKLEESSKLSQINSTLDEDEEKQEQDNGTINNYLNFTLTQFDMGAPWEDLSKSYGNDSTEAAQSFKLVFEHRRIQKKWAWSAGLGYSTISQPSIAFQMAHIEGSIIYVPIRSTWFNVDLFTGILISGGVKLEVQGDHAKHEGNMYGFMTGTKIKILPYNKFGVFLGASLQVLNISGMGNINLPDGTIRKFDKITGTQIFGGMSYRF
jgi:hypothetical protein